MPAGPGVVDVNGIRLFGEADGGTMSDVLNLGMASVSTQIAADRVRLLAIEKKVYVGANSAARDAYFGTPASAAARRALQDSGAQFQRLDKGWTEQYYAGPTDGGSNPGGATTAGWYPVFGVMPGYEGTCGATASVTAGTVVVLTEVKRSNLAAAVSNVLTPGIQGWWGISYQQQWNVGTAGATVSGTIRKNGATIAQDQTPVATANGVGTAAVVDRTFLTATDTIDFLASATVSNGRIAAGSRVSLGYLGVV